MNEETNIKTIDTLLQDGKEIEAFSILDKSNKIYCGKILEQIEKKYYFGFRTLGTSDGKTEGNASLLKIKQSCQEYLFDKNVGKYNTNVKSENVEEVLEEIESFPITCDSECDMEKLLALKRISREFLSNFNKYTPEECQKLYFGIQMADFHYHRGVEIKFNILYPSDNQSDKK